MNKTDRQLRPNTLPRRIRFSRVYYER